MTMKNKTLNKLVRYAVSAIALLVVLSSIVVCFVFAKYVTEREQNISLNVTAYGGDIDLALCEGESEDLWVDAEHRFLLRPSAEYVFDPYVHITVNGNDRECYLFVKVEEIGGVIIANGKEYGFKDFVSYSVALGWTQGDGENIPSNVYYRLVSAEERNNYYPIISEDTVVIPSVTPEWAFTELADNGTLPSFAISAYAIELTVLEDATSVANRTPEGAWEWMQANETPVPPEAETGNSGEGEAIPEPAP